MNMNSNSSFFRSGSATDVIAKARALAEDIARIVADGAPSEMVLSDAPLLDRWILTTRIRPALTEICTGHPLLGDQRIVTSELFAIDPQGSWARTYSRFYRLGHPGRSTPGADQ